MADTAWTIIRGGRLLDIAPRRADPADLLIEGDTIREIGRPGLAAPEGARTIDARDRLLLPGLVNAHTHSHGALAKGLVGDRLPLEVFLASSGALNASRTLEDKYLSALVSAIEMVRKGCTACYDLFVEYPVPSADGVHAVGRAYQDVGMRAVIAPMVADRTLYQALPGLLAALPERVRAEVEKIRTAPYEASLVACREVLRSWPYDRARVRPALGPTIPLHCSDEFLVACRDLAREFDVGLQTHLAESRTQALLGLEKYGQTLTAHLAELGLLGPTFSAAHAVWLDRDDVKRLADAGAAVAHNPLSNLRLGSGLAPVRMMLGHGVRVGVGTDATNTSDTQNMFEAMRLASYISRVQTSASSDWLSVEEALAMATAGSAAVLGMEQAIGRIAPRAKADIVFLDLGHINYVPLNDPRLQVVNSESGAAVDSVMIDGRLVLERGRLLTVDEAKVRAQVAETTARLNAANAEAVNASRSLGELVRAFCATHARRPYPVQRLADHCGG